MTITISVFAESDKLQEVLESVVQGALTFPDASVS